MQSSAIRCNGTGARCKSGTSVEPCDQADRFPRFPISAFPRWHFPTCGYISPRLSESLIKETERVLIKHPVDARALLINIAIQPGDLVDTSLSVATAKLTNDDGGLMRHAALGKLFRDPNLLRRCSDIGCVIRTTIWTDLFRLGLCCCGRLFCVFSRREMNSVPNHCAALDRIFPFSGGRSANR